MENQGHPPFKTVRIADMLRECGVVPTDPMQDIREGHRYLLFVDPALVSNASAKKLMEFFASKNYDISVLSIPPGAAHLFDVSKDDEVASYAYFNSALLCAECGWAMSPFKSNYTVRPFDYIVSCCNSSCSRHEINYRVKPSTGVRLERIDGKEEANERRERSQQGTGDGSNASAGADASTGKAGG